MRELLLLMPRIISRIKRIPIPKDLDGLTLGPRHLSVLSFLLDGPMTVNELAAQLASSSASPSPAERLSKSGFPEAHSPGAMRWTR